MEIKPVMTRRSFLKVGAAAMATLGTAPVTAASAVWPDGETEAENRLFSRIGTRCETRSGPVEGTQEGEHLVWYGIPYGASTAGDNRWRAPQEPAPWTEVLDCTAPGPVAAQTIHGPIGTEDCLRLDVYSAPKAHGCPVLVYLHGGGNQTGSARELPGGELAETVGCVFVSIEYRLGLLGFNCLPALCEEDGGNFALLDMRLALDWVQENIDAFGGDADNITVSGFSAGGRDVMAMLASPLFVGRFHRAVVFSGGMTAADPTQSARQIAAALAPLAVEDGCCAGEAEAFDWLLTEEPAVRSWLSSLEAGRLTACMARAGGRMSAFPHLYTDGVALPREGFETSAYNGVPLMLVTGSTEFSLFALWDSYFSGEEMKALAPADLEAARQFAVTYGSALYRRFNTEASAEILSTRCTAPLYLCQVEYGSSDSRTAIPALGSFHGVALPMLSADTPFAALADFSGAGYQAMAERFRAYLGHFLTDGDPNGIGLTQWQSWQADDRRTLVLDADADHAFVSCRPIADPEEEILERMAEDDTLPWERKEKVIRNVLGGRWFSAGLDVRFG